MRALCARRVALWARPRLAARASSLASASGASSLSFDNDADVGASSPTVPKHSQTTPQNLQRIQALTNAVSDRHHRVQLPNPQIQDLETLYSALMQPTSQPASREQRNHYLINQIDADKFFRPPNARERSTSNYATLIRSLGLRGDIVKVHECVASMRQYNLEPDSNVISAIIDACARSGNVEAAELCLRNAKIRGIELDATMYAGLIKAYHAGGRHPRESVGILNRMEVDDGVAADCVVYTAVMMNFLRHGLANECVDIFHRMSLRGIKPDSVSFTVLMDACAHSDMLEQAKRYFDQMEITHVAPTLPLYNAFINVCAARARSLATLPKKRRRWLRKLAVDINPEEPLKLAHRQFAAMAESGFEPDGASYVGLLRTHAAIGDAEGAQRTLSRLLDSGIQAKPSHFHILLMACVRCGLLKPRSEHEAALQLAGSVLPSMETLGLEITDVPISLTIGAYAAANKVHRASALLEELPARYGRKPSVQACKHLLNMCDRIHRGALAREIVDKMLELGYDVAEGVLRLPGEIEMRRDKAYSAYPALPKVSWSKYRGGFVHKGAPAGAERRWLTSRGERRRHRAALLNPPRLRRRLGA